MQNAFISGKSMYADFLIYMLFLCFIIYFVIRSIFSRSSCVNVIFFSMSMLSKI